MAYHAVPRVMMYEGDARVPLEAEQWQKQYYVVFLKEMMAKQSVK